MTTHYGAIPYRIINETTQIALVENYKGERGFPKGGNEKQLPRLEAALAELMQETTFTMKKLHEHEPFIMEYRKDGKLKQVTLFLMTVNEEDRNPIPTNDPDNDVKKEGSWFSFEEAKRYVEAGRGKQTATLDVIKKLKDVRF